MVEDEWLLFGRGATPDQLRYVELPVDFHLRELAELAPTVEAVLGLSEQYGRLGLPGWTDLPSVAAAEENYERMVLAQATANQRPGLAGVETTDGRTLTRLRRDVAERNRWLEELVVHVDELALRASLLRTLAAHAVAHREEQDVAAVWPNCDDELDAWDRFTRLLNTALEPYSVRLYVDLGGPLNLNIGEPRPSLYAAVALQLVSDMAAGAVYRQCANPTCRRTFTRQRGRADYGQYRSSGVLYCDRSCARAQAAREGRRRARDKRREG